MFEGYYLFLLVDGVKSPFATFLPFDLNQISISPTHMDYFDEIENEEAPQSYQPPQEEPDQQEPEFNEAPQPPQESNQAPSIDFGSYPSTEPNTAVYAAESADNEFNDFEEDQMTKHIREQEERVQNMLRDKSQKQYEQKNARKSEGQRQLEEFLSRKEKEKNERGEDNVRKEQELRAEYKRLTQEAGWSKVVKNVNVKQGEHKGKKDINRMREAILHKRQDNSRS